MTEWLAGSWFTLSLSGILVPSVAWLVKEVLAQRNKLVELETRIAGIERECQKHLADTATISTLVHHIDKNMGRVCMALKIAETD